MADGRFIIADCITLEEVEARILDFGKAGYEVRFMGLPLFP